MANYYVASNSNNAEGPYSFEELAQRFDVGEITRETLVCPEGGQEWFSFGSVYKHYREEMLLEKKVSQRNLIESKKESILEKDLLEIKITIEGIFRVVGVIALLAGIVLFYSTADDGQQALCFIYLISGAFSCLLCFWFAKVLTLLQRIADKK